MAKLSQLEIIGPDGEILFYDLDPAKGVTNIGRHPDNDIIVDSPNAALFHAMIDHRRAPFQVVLLSEEAALTVAGQPLSPNAPAAVSDWDAIEFDGYTFIVLEGAGSVAPPSRQTSALAVPMSIVPPGAPPPPPADGTAPSTAGVFVPSQAGAAAPAGPFAQPGAVPPTQAMQAIVPAYHDQEDDFILVEVSAREWSVNVDEVATCQVTIINGGDLVAEFVVRVEGLPPGWVSISSTDLNLNEGARKSVSISMGAPRHPTSMARAYPLAIDVTSPNYPGRLTRTSATFNILPYFEFAVGELSPKEQTVRWVREEAEAEIPITNKGNSETPFRLDGEDTEKACVFEYWVPGAETAVVKQAEMRLPPGGSYTVPIDITPPRRLIGMRKRSYSYTLTASMVGGDQIPRTVMGVIKGAPLFGPIPILLAILAVLFLTGFLFRPGPNPALRASPKTIDEPGSKTALIYNAARFGENPDNFFNRLNALFLRVTLEYKGEDGEWQVLADTKDADKPLEDINGQVSHTPRENGYYQLTAKTWVSSLLPFTKGESGVVPIFVTPVEPQITFVADRNPILDGETVTLRWETEYAETLVLEYGGIQEPIPAEDIANGQRSISLDQSATFSLIATNSSWTGDARSSQKVEVLYPTPAVVQFDVAPQVVTLGESVQVDWEVSGADTVSIDPLGPFPIKGNTSDQPPELRRYKLVASKTGADGSVVQSDTFIKEVTVHTPTPTAAPPVIQIFNATPNQIVIGDDQTVTLRWQISGATTKVEINTGSALIPVDADDPNGRALRVEKTTTFILVAYNGDAEPAAASVEVVALEPTPTETPVPPTETPVPTETPTPTATPIPPPVIGYFVAEEGPKVQFLNPVSSSQGPILKYSVEVGADMVLAWKVDGADVVTLDGQNVQLFTDKKTVSNVTAAHLYQLTAYNNSGVNVVSAFVDISLYLPPAPPPPASISGVVGSGVITLTWSYATTPGAIPVTGFRVYGSNVSPQTNFTVVGSEYVTPTLPVSPPSTFTMVDNLSPNPTCGRAYYVVALYQDIIAGVEKETNASGSSWYSPLCP